MAFNFPTCLVPAPIKRLVPLLPGDGQSATTLLPDWELHLLRELYLESDGALAGQRQIEDRAFGQLCHLLCGGFRTFMDYATGQRTRRSRTDRVLSVPACVDLFNVLLRDRDSALSVYRAVFCPDTRRYVGLIRQRPGSPWHDVPTVLERLCAHRPDYEVAAWTDGQELLTVWRKGVPDRAICVAFALFADRSPRLYPAICPTQKRSAVAAVGPDVPAGSSIRTLLQRFERMQTRLDGGSWNLVGPEASAALCRQMLELVARIAARYNVTGELTRKLLTVASSDEPRGLLAELMRTDHAETVGELVSLHRLGAEIVQDTRLWKWSS